MFSRIRRLGVLSLAALFFGGAILIFTAVNGLFGPATVKGRSTIDDRMRVFQYGSQSSVQAWIAIVGVGFGLLSYGFNEAYTHLFDWWCSRRAQRGDGLEYGLYLNSQPRAPVLYGRRGFTGLITLRYLFITASIAASIGYKFGISQTGLFFEGPVDAEKLSLSSPSISKPGYHGEFSPCIADNTDNEQNRGFFYSDSEKAEPPDSITMTGLLECLDGSTDSVSFGLLRTGEVVMVAEKTEVEGDFTMTRDTDGWRRSYTDGNFWLASKGSRVVVDWTVPQADVVMIQWADYAPWLEGPDNDLTVERRISYKMHFAVAEVERVVEGWFCSSLSYHDPRVISDDYKAAIPEGDDDSLVPDLEIMDWPVPLISYWGQYPRRGVSSIVQVAMARLLSNFDTLPLKFVPGVSHPFESGKGNQSQVDDKQTEYFAFPYLNGNGLSGTGIWISAARVFMGIGCFSVVVGFIRIFVGPPVLTSWMAQHIYLAQSGALTVSVSQEGLLTGYEGAEKAFGRLRLPKEGRGLGREWER